MHWDPLKSADRVQSREAMGAMGRDGTMEPCRKGRGGGEGG